MGRRKQNCPQKTGLTSSNDGKEGGKVPRGRQLIRGSTRLPTTKNVNTEIDDLTTASILSLVSCQNLALSAKT